MAHSSRVKFLLIFLLSIVGVFLSCKKDSNNYEITYVINNNISNRWYSDKAEAIIKSDSLVVTGKKNDGSTVVVIVSDSKVGNYPVSVTSMQSLVVVNRDGSKDNSSNYLSIEGNVSITANDESKKVITGKFDVKAVRTADILNPDNISGEFTAKYTKY